MTKKFILKRFDPQKPKFLKESCALKSAIISSTELSNGRQVLLIDTGSFNNIAGRSWLNRTDDLVTAASIASELKVSIDSVIYFQSSAVVTMARLVCKLCNLEAFPYCCLDGTCAKPLTFEDLQDHRFDGQHWWVSYKDALQKYCGGVDATKKTSNYWEECDRTNIILKLLCRNCSLRTLRPL